VPQRMQSVNTPRITGTTTNGEDMCMVGKLLVETG
jgi:hypothetical protein